MTKITIEVPEDMEHRAKMLKVELSLLAVMAIKKSLQDLEEIEHFKNSVAKSKLTEKDADELSDKVNKAMREHHKKKFSL